MWKAVDGGDAEEVELLLKSLFDGKPFINVYDVFESPRDDDRISGGVVLFNVQRPGTATDVDELGRMLKSRARGRFSFVLIRSGRGVAISHSYDLDQQRLRTICNS